MKCAAIPQNLHQEGLVTKGAALNQSTAVTWMTKSKTMTQALISTCEADVSEEEEEPGARPRDEGGRFQTALRF
ncbi:hypothetical protein INR49_018887 [Caranx melampygus]|nr:hypothetical protein INR49_018887 [Caranx melampygus]